MLSVRWVRLAGVVLLVSSLARVPAAIGASAVEELAKRMPDETIAFVGTSGSDALKGDFEKTIVGRIWNDPGVRKFYRSIKTELIAKVGQESRDPNLSKNVDMVLDSIRLAVSRPIVIGIMPGPPVQKAPPITGFAILDAGDRKAQFAAIVGKLEAMAGPEGIFDKEIGTLKLRAAQDRDGALVYWGWAGDLFVIAVNDAPGAAVKYVTKPRLTAPACLGKLPGSGDALVAYGDVRQLGQLLGLMIGNEIGPHERNLYSAVFRGLGLSDVRSITLRAGFVGADVLAHAVVEMPAPTTGVLAALKPVDPFCFGSVDTRAMMAAAVNCDVGALYDTIMGVVKTVSPDKAYPEFRQVLADFEAQAGLRIREELLASLAGPAVMYSLPAGVTADAPTGGGVVLARLKDAALFEKSMTALGRFAGEKAEGQLQVSAQKRDDGRMVHFWAAGPAAMMGVMPTWSIANDHLILGFNMEMHDLAAKRFTAGQADANSLLNAAAYKKATAGLPGNLTILTYTDSQVYFNQSMMQMRQFWPMVTMMAMKEGGVKLPVMLPSLTQIAADMGPSINYNYIGPDGLHSVYRGPGFENNQMTIAGTAGAMGVLMPALARVRQLSFRMTSGTNLAGVGKACLVYMRDHDDKLPPDLETLVTEADLPAGCLESKLKPTDFDGPSYLYIPGQDMSMPPGNVLAYENPEFCTEGVNVLFLDTHVEFVKPQAFREAMKATYTRLRRPLPAIRFRDDKADDGATPSVGDDVAKSPAAEPFALHEAAGQGDLERVRALLDGGARIDLEDNQRETPLTLALKAGRLQVAWLLIDRGANVNHPGGSWGSPLQIAARQGYASTVRTLIARGADVEAKLTVGWTPLLLAVRLGRTDAAGVLIDAGANLQAKTNEEMTPLLFAILHKRPEIEKLLLAKGVRSDVFAECMRGDAAAVAACVKRDPGLLKAKVGQLTLLHWAAYCNHLEVAKALLENGADVQANWENAPPLYWAVRKGKPEMIELFCKHGADVNRKNRDGWTVLHNAVTPEAVELLVNHGADVNARTRNGFSPLHSAASDIGHTGAMKLLLPEDADINLNYPDSLHRQAAVRQAAVVTALLARGAEVNAVDEKGNTALDIAEGMRYEPVAAVLREHGGKQGRELNPGVGDASNN